MNRFCLSLFLALGLVFGFCANAEEPDHGKEKIAYIQGIADQIFNILSDKQPTKDQKIEKIRKIIEREVDFEWNAKMALGVNGRQMSEQDFKKFVGLYREMLCQNWATKFSVAENAKRSDLVFSERVVKINSTDDVVAFYVETRNGNKINIKIVTRTLGTTGKDFKVVDLVAEGVSIALSYRNQFNAYIDEHGIAKLIPHLESVVSKK